MAYYDQFTKKPRSPRDDWRDDEETLRPERDGEKNRRRKGQIAQAEGEKRENDGFGRVHGGLLSAGLLCLSAPGFSDFKGTNRG